MTAVATLSLLVWLYLALGHGRFWQSGPALTPARPAAAPPVAIVVPARNEAMGVGAALRSLLAQDYPGAWRVILVDDGSEDATGAIARELAGDRLTVLDGLPRPPGWAGKLWALHQGIAHADGAALLLLTDADIVHDPRHLATLVEKAERDRLDLVSEMVRLSCAGAAERWLVPPFVFFFQLLYPFARVNDPGRRIAAAAGGTMLVRAEALRRIGGIAAIRGALIDDVALAAAIKRGGRIWLGHSRLAESLRPYRDMRDVWRMVARSAYVQLRFSPAALAATLLGMALVWVAPPSLALFGQGPARLLGAAAWAVASLCYLPTLRRFDLSPAWALGLPAAAVFYAAATCGSALDHWRGRGVVWRGRAYAGSRA